MYLSLVSPDSSNFPLSYLLYIHCDRPIPLTIVDQSLLSFPSSMCSCTYAEEPFMFEFNACRFSLVIMICIRVTDKAQTTLHY
jgi:hypothetical protein